MSRDVDRDLLEAGPRLAAAAHRGASPVAEPDGVAADEPVESDGRRRRSERNRRAVVDALLDLLRDGNLRPSAAEVAARAGLSPRSLFRYFDDLDDLLRAAVARQHQRAAPLLRVAADPGDATRRKIDALVDQRVTLFEAVGPAASVSRLNAPFQPLLANELAQGRAFLRAQVADLFASELAAVARRRARRVLAAADVVSSFEAYQLLRFDQGVSAAEARATMVEALVGLLDAPSS